MLDIAIQIELRYNKTILYGAFSWKKVPCHKALKEDEKMRNPTLFNRTTPQNQRKADR